MEYQQSATSVDPNPSANFSDLALPTATISFTVAIALLFWPERTMLLALDQTASGHLFWAMGGIAILSNGVVYYDTFGKRLWSRNGIIELGGLFLTVVSLTAMFIAFPPVPWASMHSQAFWQQISPEVFRRLAINIVAYAYLGLITSLFLPSLVSAIMTSIAYRLFAKVDSEVEGKIT